ncbi:uncharacterized protein N7483_004658 [Penicillium malachiteum]|uniref:uncharacterized protein n=1 Tax=Penicillium malachiteum TaxID=1324776 RepID=UPI002549681E|nr:uncharacterized protein N7483_004658 [Penicillium malachiteum]KAJ5730150.1 hypothetical protein N7483_004658 [Penicillium malachiteum]
MTTNISHNGINGGFQPGVINGNIGSVTIGQTASLDQECLRALRTTDPRHDKERIKDSKGGLLEDCYRWILENQAFKQWQNSQSNRLLCIRGDPGKGKTMLLCGIIEELQQLSGDNATVSFFFCQATDIRINSATSVLRGLIYLLIEKNPSLLSHVRSQYGKAGKALFEDVNAWSALTTIFISILEDSSLKTTYVIIDALDECTSGLDLLLKLIVQKSAAYPQVKWIISSRNYPIIIKRLNSATQIAPISLELNEASVSKAVELFINQKVNDIAGTGEYDPKTRETVRDYLLLNSRGTFLWVALVCKELEETEWWHAEEIVRTFPPGLSTLYRRMLNQIYETRDANICKEILSIISLVYRPITLSELDTIIERRINDSINPVILRRIIGFCGSFLTLRDENVTFVHQSAKDFLTIEASTEIFLEGLDDKHHAIFSQCLNALFKTLQRDILGLKFPGISTKDISMPSPNPLAPAEYACVYWVDHLHDCKNNITYRLSLKNREKLDKFMQEKFLHWLEALSILGVLSDGIHAMRRLESLIQEESESDGLLERAQDASRFVQYHRAGIESSPLQVYCSPLIFSPSKSLTRIAFQEERPNWVLNYPRVEEDWSACLQTLEGHSESVQSITWSPDGSRLASGSSDNTVCIWDPATGQSVSTLNRHSHSVWAIAWSPDGSRLASGSSDNTVRIWDPASGQSMSTLKGHSAWVRSIAWSPDGSRLASGSWDKTVRIWDPATGQSVSTLKGHGDWVSSIAWSLDGSRLASGSWDKTVRIWDPATGQSVSTLEGHSGWVSSIAWSPDGSQLASGSGDNTVRIWDPATGQSMSIIPNIRTKFLKFDTADLNRLHTTTGTFDTSSVAPVTSIHDSPTRSLQQCRYGLNDDRSWVTYNGLNLLWLPSEYRPRDVSFFAMHATTVAFVLSSNRAIFLALSNQCPVPTL